MPTSRRRARVILVLSTALAGCAPVTTVRAGFDHRAVIGTDGAQIVLADPERLLDHRHDPSGWQYTAGATLEDRRGGHFLYFSTGGDGGFEVRVTDGSLEPREAEHAAGSIVLRLRVGQAGLLLDGGYAWPSEDSPVLDDSLGTRLDVPSGHYAATITAVDRPIDGEHHFTDVGHPEGPLADYVIRLTTVEDFTDVPMMDATPRLMAYEDPSTIPFDPMSYFEEECGEVPAVAVRRPLDNGRLPAPNEYWSGAVSIALYDQVSREASDGMDPFPEPIAAAEGASFGFPSSVPIVVASADTSGTVGMYVSVSGRSRSRDEGGALTTELHGSVRCAVTVTGQAPPPAELASLSDVVSFVAIEALPLDVSEPDGAVSEALARAYAGWLMRSTRRDVPYRLAALAEASDPRHRFAEIVRYVEPPADRLAEWIAADAASRDRALTGWLGQ